MVVGRRRRNADENPGIGVDQVHHRFVYNSMTTKLNGCVSSVGVLSLGTGVSELETVSVG